jgi:hypothetical protein
MPSKNLTPSAILAAAVCAFLVPAAVAGTLVCNDQSVLDYQRIQLLAGRMTIGPDLPGTPEQHRVIHENFDKLSFDDGKTYFVVAHKPTGKLFLSDCAAETCSFEEISASMDRCQRMHYGAGNMDTDACMFLAVRFRNKDFCLQRPAAEN